MRRSATAVAERDEGRSARAVQAELLNMLESGGREAAPAPPPPRSNPHKPAAPATTKAPTAEAEGCAECGSLRPWGTASWCPDCGYYPAIGRRGEVPTTDDGELEELDWSQLVPGWALALVVGIIGIIAGTIVLQRLLAEFPGYLSLGSLVIFSFGTILLVIAHVSAMLTGLNDSKAPSLGGFLFYPPAVWWPVFRGLPERSHLVVNLGWGVTACVTSLLILGPIQMSAIKDQLAKREKPKGSVMGKMVGTMAKTVPQKGGGGGNGSIEDAVAGFSGDVEQSLQGGQGNGGASSLEGAVGEFAGTATEQSGLNEVGNPGTGSAVGAGDARGASGGKPSVERTDGPGSGAAEVGDRKPDANHPDVEGTDKPAAPKKPSRVVGAHAAPRVTSLLTGGSAGKKQIDVVLFGYLSNPSGEVRTLLLATDGSDGSPRFAGKLSEDSFPSAEWRELVARLPELRMRRPLVSCPYGGQWVRPAYGFSIRYDRWLNHLFEGAEVESIVHEPAGLGLTQR